ncbi:hypothetical protein [Micromonospora sp. NBS 11-29]|uniref:hypothetical protein n=1 Tax=Micromonospora sp. NBS 11-29 TaxID=1960879 RepID=UPI00111EB11E|nr:hypothetical protein [Micromonospora sp. NBS 11-29]
MSDVTPCPECAGTGCPRCHWRGRRRAQLLLTVANTDTGAVASHRVTPADLAPRPDAAGAVVADLTPRVRALASTVAVALDPEPVLVRLPPAWRPELPAAERYALAAAALADAARRPWRLWLGGTAAAAPVDPGTRLARLCHLADLLLLDLVATVRRRAGRPWWTVRYEVPGSPVPDGPVEGAPDLATALLRTDAAAALAGLTERGLTAPARLLDPVPPCPGERAPLLGPVPPPVDVERIERRVLAELVESTGTGRPGAQAVWRDGRWWYTGLRRADGGPSTPAPGRGAGPCAVAPGRGAGPSAPAPGRFGGPSAMALGRVAEPPGPTRLGEMMPGRACPDCRSVGPTRDCRCRAAGPVPVLPRSDPMPASSPTPVEGCDRCGGTERRRSALRCATCGGSRRLHRAVLVTITDLRHRVVHLTWRGGAPEATRTVTTTPDGRAVVQLPERYRLGAWARVFGVPPEELAEADGGHPIPRALRDGCVTLPWVGADPVREYVRQAGGGLPAGRLVVTATRPAAPPPGELIRLVLGLDLALHVGVLDLRQHAGHPLRPDGRWWSAQVRPRDAPVHPDDLPTRPSLAAALADCLADLADDVGELVPTDPDESLPAPGAPARAPAANPLPELARLAAEHPGRAVTLRVTRAGRTVHRHDDDGVRLVGQGG